MKTELSTVCEHRCHLGEGPVWDARHDWLYWVDSYAPALYRHDFHAGRTESWPLPGKAVGSLAVRAQEGLVLALDRGFYFFDPHSNACDLIAEPLAGQTGMRLNDGKVDPFGAFVAGGMNIDYRQHLDCAMYRLAPTLEVSEILRGFDCFNGPCFSEDGTQLYVTGRHDGVVEAFDYTPGTKLGNPRVLLESCNPDGATVDAEGYIWSAQWNDACILRISPQGEIERRIEVPGQIVSSVMFGGPELDLIYITTVGGEVHGARPQGADAGKTLVLSGSGVRGRTEPEFLG